MQKKITFVSVDNKEFATEAECLEHEAGIKGGLINDARTGLAAFMADKPHFSTSNRTAFSESLEAKLPEFLKTVIQPLCLAQGVEISFTPPAAPKQRKPRVTKEAAPAAETEEWPGKSQGAPPPPPSRHA